MTWFERGSKPQSTSDVMNMVRLNFSAFRDFLVKTGKDIHRILKETNKIVKVGQGMESWRNYLSYVNGLVVDGLTSVILNALTTVQQQLDPAHIAKAEIQPLFRIDLDLLGLSVDFVPSL